MSKKPEEEKLQNQLKRLKEIVTELENGDATDVEAGLEQVKEGAKLVKSARKRFAEIENEFSDIKEDLEHDE